MFTYTQIDDTKKHYKQAYVTYTHDFQAHCCSKFIENKC
jgi:hypothetical protein